MLEDDPQWVLAQGVQLGDANPYEWGFYMYLVCSIIIVVVNAWVIAAIAIDTALRSSIHNLLVAGQTLTVFAYGLFNLIYTIINLSTRPIHFWGGLQNCNIIGILTVVFIAASSLYLLLIAYVRYRSIILNKSFTVKQWLWWTIIVWLVSIINPIYFWLIADMRLVKSGTRCLPNWQRLAIGIPAIVQVLAFFITFSIVYIKCVKYIRSAQLNYSTSPEVARYLTHQRRLTHQMIAIVLLFSLTSAPEIIQWFVEMIYQTHESATFDMISASFVLIHNIINPFVYIAMSARIRGSCLHLLSYILPCFATRLNHLSKSIHHKHHKKTHLKHIELSPRQSSPHHVTSVTSTESSAGTRHGIDLDPIRPSTPAMKGLHTKDDITIMSIQSSPSLPHDHIPYISPSYHAITPAYVVTNTPPDFDILQSHHTHGISSPSVSTIHNPTHGISPSISQQMTHRDLSGMTLPGSQHIEPIALPEQEI